MRNYFNEIQGLFLVLGLFLIACGGSKKVQSSDSIIWNATTHDFDSIPQNKPVFFDFTFQNKTESPLLIDNVRTSCGCTGTRWPEEAIAVNATGKIEVEFDAKQPGFFYKKAKVYFKGIPGAKIIFIQGVVVP